MRKLLILFSCTLLFSSLGSAGSGSGGFPNVSQTPGTVLSGLNAPNQGRTAIIAYHSGLLFTLPELPGSQGGSDFQVRSWDLSDPTQPVEVEQYGVSPMPINAHGYFKSGEYLVVGPNWPPEAPWSFRAAGVGSVDRVEYPDLYCAGVRGCLFQPWYIGDTYWSYGDVGGDAFLQRNGVEQSSWDHLGLTGVIGHPFIVGDLLIFASDQSRTGVATYDISDPTNPVLLDVLTTGGAGGYWPELWGGDGKLYVIFPYRSNGNGFRVVDVTDPTNLQFLADRALPGAESMYIQFQDEFAFMGDHKVDMRSFESVLFLDGANAVRPNDGGVGIDTSQFALPLGNLLVTGGIGPNQGMAIWAHQADPDLRGPSVGFHIPQAGRTDYPLGASISFLIHETLETSTIVNGSSFIVRPLGGVALDGELVFSFDDILTFTPENPLAESTTYEVVLAAGGIEDAAGNGMKGYSFTFSTGSSVGGNTAPEISSFSVASYPVEPGVTTTLFATATDDDGDALEYRFDFGDGSPKTEWSSQASAVHSYDDPGHYRATVQVRDTASSLDSSSTSVTVSSQTANVAPPSSTPLLCDEVGRRVLTVNPDNDTLTVMDADSLNTIFEVPVCDDPRSVALSAEDELWVTCFDSDSLQVLSANNGALVVEIALDYGSAPVGVIASPDGSQLFVALDGKRAVERYSAVSRNRTGSLALEGKPRALALSPNGNRLLVTRFLSPKDHAEVWDVDPSSMTLVDTLRIEKFGNEENRDTTASGRGVANYLSAIAINSAGDRAFVTANKPNRERGLLFTPDLDSDNTVRNVLVELDLTSGEFLRAIDLDNSDSAHGLAFSPLGDYLFVGLQGSNEVITLDTFLIEESVGLGSLVTRLAGGAAPQGVCVDNTTERTFVKAFLGREVRALETTSLFQTGSITVDSTSVSTVASEALTADELLGKQIFYHGGDDRMSAEGYLSCASCHIDGTQDGRVWDFTGRGEGLRNTADLRGRAGMQQGNVHWTANFDEIQDFEGDIRGPFGGLGFMDDDDFDDTSDPLGPPKTGLSLELDALAVYVASLERESVPPSPYRTSDGSQTAAGLRGESLFVNEGCVSCHAGVNFTDSTLGSETLHDVGTLRTTSGMRLGQPLDGVDTPTLLGVWETAPYLHDGSARELEDVFVVAGGEVIPAESGSVSGGAQIVDQYVDLNNDDTVHGRAFVGLDSTGARLTLSGVDGGSGGSGALEMRYSSGGTQNTIRLTVNGVAVSVNPPGVGNDPAWRHTNWGRVRIEDVALQPGTSNTVVLEMLDSFPNLSLDEVIVTTADHRLLAEPHHRVAALSASAQIDLMAYLRELDPQSVPPSGGGLIFTDGFESGDTDAWSSVRE